MPHQPIPFPKWLDPGLAQGSRSMWVYYPQGLLRRPLLGSDVCLDQLFEKPLGAAHQCAGGRSVLTDPIKKENENSYPGHTLFQDSFFFCTIQDVGDLPGAGRIYVETVVDRDSGVGFAKVYHARKALNAVDVLASRVMPFFQSRGVTIQEIYTRKANEYCGLTPVHPFETFLATCHVEHLPLRDFDSHLCEEFYRTLERDVFSPALRKKFQVSLDGLQNDLDTFVDAYNQGRMVDAGTGFDNALPGAAGDVKTG